MTNTVPSDWKTYDDFAAGIASNRLQNTNALATKSLLVTLVDGRRLALRFDATGQVEWEDERGAGNDAAEVIYVAPDTYFVDIAYASRPREAETLIINLKTRRVLSINATVRDAGAFPDEPQVGQVFRPGSLDGGEVSGPVPHATRDLVGLRAHFTYSPNHTYEHIYLSSQRYAWQCLIGVQRGHGDVDMATTYKFDDNQYVFAFREFKIPVASTFFYNFVDMRSTGKFLGITRNGSIQNRPAGAHIQRASMTYYAQGQEPV